MWVQHTLKLAHDYFIYGQDADTFDTARRTACTAADNRDKGDENPRGRVPIHKVFCRKARGRLYSYGVEKRETGSIGQRAVIAKVKHQHPDEGNGKNNAKKYAQFVVFPHIFPMLFEQAEV